MLANGDFTFGSSALLLGVSLRRAPGAHLLLKNGLPQRTTVVDCSQKAFVGQGVAAAWLRFSGRSSHFDFLGGMWGCG